MEAGHQMRGHVMSHEVHGRGVKGALKVRRLQTRDDSGGLKSTLKTVLALRPSQRSA